MDSIALKKLRDKIEALNSVVQELKDEFAEVETALIPERDDDYYYRLVKNVNILASGGVVMSELSILGYWNEQTAHGYITVETSIRHYRDGMVKTIEHHRIFITNTNQDYIVQRMDELEHDKALMAVFKSQHSACIED